MRDRQTESESPTELLSLEELGAILCFAPHPDDEVFGAGGLMALAAANGQRVEVVVLSRGERAGGEASDLLGNERLEESRRAAAELGVSEPTFLDWPDRGIFYSENLIRDLAAEIVQRRPRTVLLPALTEPHPDHQSLALAGAAAAMRVQPAPDLLFYEVGAPTQPNALIDITSVASRKWAAIAAFESQEALQPYARQIRALATVRAFAIGGRCEAAEAFMRVEASALRRDGPAAMAPGWAALRLQRGLAADPAQLPLVSVLVRSMDRPVLAEALASVAAQTYPNLEVVIVCATGRPHTALPGLPRNIRARLLQPGADGGGAPTPVDRSAAANLALQAAGGELAIFLDDDDLLLPEHIDRLVTALHDHPRAMAAYAGVRVEDAAGTVARVYDLPWSRERLEGVNFLPIHAVLFRLDPVRRHALRFDEALPVLEDWAFWRALARVGEFAHVPGVSAVYRQFHGASGISDPTRPNHWKLWHARILESSAAGFAPRETAGLLAWHAIELERAEANLGVLTRERDTLIRALASTQARVAALETEQAVLRNSRSWRLTRPLRALAAAVRAIRGRR